MTKPCQRTGCQQRHQNAKYCSYGCRNAAEWGALTAEQRSAKGKRMARARLGQQMNRMLQRVKALADSPDDRMLLAYRYGLAASKVRRYRQRQGKVA